MCNETASSYYFTTLSWQSSTDCGITGLVCWYRACNEQEPNADLKRPLRELHINESVTQSTLPTPGLLMWMGSFFSPVSHTLHCGSLITFTPLPFHQAHCLPGPRYIFQTCCNLFVFIVVWTNCSPCVLCAWEQVWIFMRLMFLHSFDTQSQELHELSWKWIQNILYWQGNSGPCLFLYSRFKLSHLPLMVKFCYHSDFVTFDCF